MLENLKFLKTKWKIETICAIITIVFSHLNRFDLKKSVTFFGSNLFSFQNKSFSNTLSVIFFQNYHYK